MSVAPQDSILIVDFGSPKLREAADSPCWRTTATKVAMSSELGGMPGRPFRFRNAMSSKRDLAPRLGRYTLKYGLSRSMAPATGRKG